MFGLLGATAATGLFNYILREL
uniref:Uncharacterized protein n=1 Tax=Lepeophtheirus salmonis TaxID=72036 RepID=A0A0K2UEE9_LEPSM